MRIDSFFDFLWCSIALIIIGGACGYTQRERERSSTVGINNRKEEILCCSSFCSVFSVNQHTHGSIRIDSEVNFLSYDQISVSSVHRTTSNRAQVPSAPKSKRKSRLFIPIIGRNSYQLNFVCKVKLWFLRFINIFRVLKLKS